MPAPAPKISALVILPCATGNLSAVRRALAGTNWLCTEFPEPSAAFAQLALIIRRDVHAHAAGKSAALATPPRLVVVDPASAPFFPALADALARFFPSVELWLLDSASATLHPASVVRPPASAPPAARPLDAASLLADPPPSRPQRSPRIAPVHRPARPVLRLAETDDDDADDLITPAPLNSPSPGAAPVQPPGIDSPIPDPDAQAADPHRLTREEIQMLLERDPPPSSQ